jgi:hypothetical protein
MAMDSKSRLKFKRLTRRAAQKITLKAYTGTVPEPEEGFPAYCLLVTSAVEEDYQKELVANLAQLGNAYGQNVYAALLDKGSPSFLTIQKQLMLNDLPAIVLTDSAKINKNSFRIVLQRVELLKKPKQAFDVVEKLILLMFNGSEKDAAKKAAMEQNDAWFSEHIIKNVTSFLKKVKVTLAFGPASISFDGSH